MVFASIEELASMSAASIMCSFGDLTDTLPVLPQPEDSTIGCRSLHPRAHSAF